MEALPFLVTVQAHPWLRDRAGKGEGWGVGGAVGSPVLEKLEEHV